MKAKEVSELLQRFYDGTSTPDEEKRLMVFFQQETVPDEWIPDREYFLAMQDIQDEPVAVPSDIRQKILETLEPAQARSTVRTLRPAKLYSAISVAAGILILASALFFLNRKPDLGSYSDPEMAYAETKEALEMVGRYFGKGTEHLPSLKKIETPQKSLEHLKSFEQGLDQTRGLILVEQ